MLNSLLPNFAFWLFKFPFGTFSRFGFKFPFFLRNPLGGLFSRFKFPFAQNSRFGLKREKVPKGNLTRASIKSLRQRCQNYLVSNLNSLLGKFRVLTRASIKSLRQRINPKEHWTDPKAKKALSKGTRQLTINPKEHWTGKEAKKALRERTRQLAIKPSCAALNLKSNFAHRRDIFVYSPSPPR